MRCAFISFTTFDSSMHGCLLRRVYRVDS
jgi:hypothetical protein